MEARERLDTMVAGYQDAIILLTAGRLGVYGALAERPRTAAELATALELDRRALELVLLALVAAEILACETAADGAVIFSITPSFRPYLDPASADTAASIMNHHCHLVGRWARLTEVLQSGQPVPRPAEGCTEAELRAFICGMKDISLRSSQEVVAALDLSGFKRLLDLGGGPATSAIIFCQHHPGLNCVVFDLPEVVPIAEEEITAAGLGERITTLGGDYLATDSPDAGDDLGSGGSGDIGSGYDCVYISNIIHSLSPAETALLVGKSHAALDAGGTIILKDFFLADSRTEPAFGARFSVNMLVGSEGGKSYTWTETEQILTDSGFVDCQRHEIAKASGLLLARKA